MSVISLSRELWLEYGSLESLCRSGSLPLKEEWRGWRKGSSATEGRPGWGPDVLPVGEECRGEDGRKGRGMEREASQRLPCLSSPQCWCCSTRR